MSVELFEGWEPMEPALFEYDGRPVEGVINGGRPGVIELLTGAHVGRLVTVDPTLRPLNPPAVEMKRAAEAALRLSRDAADAPTPGIPTVRTKWPGLAVLALTRNVSRGTVVYVEDEARLYCNGEDGWKAVLPK